MTKTVDCIFLIEHKDRELDPIKAIANHLKDRYNISSAILSIYFHAQYLIYYKAPVFILPYVTRVYEWPIGFIKNYYQNNSVTFVNMNWEQFISKTTQEYKKPNNAFIEKNVKQIAWNNGFKDFLNTKFNILSSNIMVTGNPANALLFQYVTRKEYFRHFFSSKYGLDNNKKWLFFPENYGWAFASDKLLRFKISMGYNEERAYHYREYAQKCLNAFITFISEAANQLDIEIIIRPHPSILINNYVKKFIELKGEIPKHIHLIRDYSIREWIAASDIVGSSWSSSVDDARNVGKGVFLFTPFERPSWMEVDWNNLVPNIKSVEELDYLLVNIKTSENETDANFINTHEDAIEKIAHYLYSIVLEYKKEPKSLDCLPLKLFTDKNIYKNIINRLSKDYFPYLVKPKGIIQDYFKSETFL